MPGADPNPDGACHATIAICTYNRVSTLPRTLAALRQLRGPWRFEILVVNGPSTDGTAAFLAGCEGVRVFDNPEANLAVSRNIAIANAAGEYVAFIDDDAVPEYDWLTLVLDRFAAAPDLAGIGGFIRDANGMSFQAKYVFCDVFGENYPCETADYRVFLAREMRLYPSLTGTNVVFRKSALERIGGFDEIFAYYLDETDVNKRMDDAGLPVEVLPAAEIHHKYAPSHLRTAANVPTSMFPVARSIGYFAIRHGAPELGWEKAVRHLQSFYLRELDWKQQTWAAGQIDMHGFDRLMTELRLGLLAGIDAAFDAMDAPAPQRLAARRAERPAAPVVHTMRAASDRLRLCMLSQDHTRLKRGGIGRWTGLVARGLVERGAEVTVIGELEKGAPQEYCDMTPEGYWSHNLRHPDREAGREVDCLGLPTGMANMSKRKLSEIRRIQPRRAFGAVSAPIWDVEGAAAIGTGELPVVLSLHTSTALMLASKPEWRRNTTYWRGHVLKVIGAELQALKRCRMILANSEAILRDISEVYDFDAASRPHRVVPHGLEDIAAPEGLLEAREAGRGDGPLRVLFLGRLETRKGVAPLVAVLGALLEAGAPIEVDLVGDRVDDANHRLVEAFVAKHPLQVRRHGFLEGPALDALMRRSDIFFGPSLYESFGLIYAEAMRYSMPCVGFATGGVPEVVTDGTDGLLAPLGDQIALRTALERLICDRDLRARMSAAARRSFETRFTYQVMAERLEAVYKEAARMEAP